MSDFENASDSESESCASSSISTTKSTKKPFPNKRKSGKISKEDEALDISVGVLKKAQDQKWKIQEVLYQAKLTAIIPQTPTQAPNSAQTFQLEPHPPIQTLNPTQAIQQGFMSPEYTP